MTSFICQRCGETWRDEEAPGECPNWTCRAVKWDEPRFAEKMCAFCNTIFEASAGIPRTGNDGPYCSDSCREKVRRVTEKRRRVNNVGFSRG